jgi:sugar lactone lactonase YvrE
MAFAASLATTLRAQAQAVPLLLPSAIAFDAQGNLYFAETGGHAIRKLSAKGLLTTVAGNGVQGFSGDHGPATAAELDSPAGLALDTAGNLYIADTHNHRVREVAAATNTITTIAGTGAPGFTGDGGAATAAQFDRPTALAVDSAGNLYLADTDNHRVRRIGAGTGIVTTVVGNGVEGFSGDNGPASTASIDSPNGLAVDGAGNLYLADTHNGRVREVSAATGIISTVAGAAALQAFGGDGGVATAASLALPRGLTIDAVGNLYIADSANHRIRRVSPSGTITTVAGQGTQAFVGDGSPAVVASIDSPRAVAISPAGSLTLADSDNQRIRQLDAQPAPGPDIHTIAGLGSGSPEALLLTGPSVIVYGSGAVTATLNVTSPATGSVTFLDNSGATTVTFGSTGLVSGSATLPTSTLAAGSHSIVATYAGDATHLAAQSSAFPLSVTPLRIVATANPASILFGQPIPSIGGELSGVLTQDAGKVAAAFTTSAVALAPVGNYPIAATLTGSAAGNYTVSLTPVSLTIAQAPTLTTLSPSSNNISPGLPVTLSIQAASTTTGTPTGTVTLLDGTTVLSVAQLSGGGATFTIGTLALGSHSLNAVYSGDTNFLPSTSAPASIIVGAASDFILTPMGATSQSIPAGSAATFNFSVAMQGAAMSSPITLAVQGTPLGATTSLSPSYLPPGGTSTSFSLTIQTPLAGLDKRSHPVSPGDRDFPGSALLAILLLPVVGLARSPNRRPRRLLIAILMSASTLALAAVATGCGNRINTAPESANAKTYTLTVTGTATSPSGTALQHSANVTLQVL